MPSELAEPTQVEYTPEFKRNLRALAKKYRHIRSDVQPMIAQLRAGEVIGNQVARTRYTIFKVRVPNSDIRRGKRSGYRVIYHLKTPTNVILMTIYSKLDQGDISAEEIRHILYKYFDTVQLIPVRNLCISKHRNARSA